MPTTQDMALKDGMDKATDHISKTSKPLPEQEMSWSYETRRGTEISPEALRQGISTAAAVDELKTAKKTHEQKYGKSGNEQDMQRSNDTRRHNGEGYSR